MIDGSAIGTVAAALMERIEADYGNAEDIEIGEVIVVAEVKIGPETSGHDAGVTIVTARCSDSRSWVQQGLLAAAMGGPE